MGQLATRGLESKRLISASLSPNISDVDKKRLEADWNEKARLRNEAIEKETAVPKVPSLILRYELHRHGRHWMSYVRHGAKLTPLLLAPSLFISAQDAITDKMAEDVRKA